MTIMQLCNYGSYGNDKLILASTQVSNRLAVRFK
jgi:hypothetical protein